MTYIAVFAVAAIIAAVWGALLGTVYVVRVVMRCGTSTSVAAVTFYYLVLAGFALVWLGSGSRGRLGAAGMLVPYATAILLSVTVRPQRR